MYPSLHNLGVQNLTNRRRLFAVSGGHPPKGLEPRATIGESRSPCNRHVYAKSAKDHIECAFVRRLRHCGASPLSRKSALAFRFLLLFLVKCISPEQKKDQP